MGQQRQSENGPMVTVIPIRIAGMSGTTVKPAARTKRASG
jgi:hypothetical protein